MKNFLIVISVILIPAIVGYFLFTKGPSREDLIYNAIKSEILSRVYTPATATFPPFTEVKIKHTKKGEFQVRGYLDAQNRFGAVIRNYYRGTLIELPDGHLTAVIIKFDQYELPEDDDDADNTFLESLDSSKYYKKR